MAISRWLAAALALVVVAGPSLSAAEDGSRPGDQLFQYCVACHGDAGAGNPAVAAPAIAGLPAWYVEAQLLKFRAGGRGMHPDDVEGMRMRPMSLTLRSDAEVKAVAAYVASLPPAHPAPTLTGGDAKRGETLFRPCIACHGPRGGGNQALGGPPLAGATDAYLWRQIAKFKAGIRGGDPAKDPKGAMMRPMANTLPDDQAVRDVIAYIVTLSQ